MKKLLLGLGALALISGSAAAALPRQSLDTHSQYERLIQRQNSNERLWRKGAAAPGHHQTAITKIVTEADGALDPSSTWGTLDMPSGETWWYTLDFNYNASNSNSIESANITVYTAQLQKYSEITVSFSLREGETSINYVQLNPTISKKFFNYDDAYEVMVFVHATTADYQGHYYTQVYSLKDGNHIADFEGNKIASVDTAPDPWSENFTMIFMRETYDADYNYWLHFDVYKKGGWGSDGAKLVHTFDVDYSTYAGTGDVALPFLINVRNGKDIFYALPHYEKPFFVDNENYWSDNPDVSPDNNFVIELYDDTYNLVKTTSIPMDSAPEGYLFSFPGTGELMGFNDMVFDQFGNSEWPAYIVCYENYTVSIDEFISDFKVYDIDGNELATITENAYDYTAMGDVKGAEKQFCFYKTDEQTYSYFEFVDFPSCVSRTILNTAQDEGNSLSISLDRVAKGDSYAYAVSMAQGEVNRENEVLHPIRWFNPDGSILRTDYINLGKDVVMAQPCMAQYALDPYLFNTDPTVEYMFLVKEQISSESSKTKESLKIYSGDNLLLDMGPDPETGDILRSITVANPGTNNAKLIVVYTDYENMTIKHISLPFVKFNGGTGSETDPYLLSTAGDVMAMYTDPAACYALANDIDFNNEYWAGNSCEFRGTLDGRGHTITNLNISNGIFQSLTNHALVKDLIITNSNLTGNQGGFIAADANGDSSASHPKIQNVRLYNCSITGAEDNLGGIIGTAYVYTEVSECLAEDIEISAPTATVGGIAGRVQLGVTVKACYVSGIIEGENAGGIAGKSFKGDETITNCHVNAEIFGLVNAGGILGESNRSIVSNCYVEGSVVAIGTKEAYAGGVVGQLAPTYDKNNTTNVVHNNIVALTAVDAQADKAVAHRIVGCTSGDMTFINWDRVTEDMDPSEYPTLNGDAETHIYHNYAIGISANDPTLEGIDTAEGLSITYADVTAEFLAAGGWAIGETKDSPWVHGTDGLNLYFEKRDPITGIIDITTPTNVNIHFDGICLRAAGLIEVYNAAGLLVAKSTDCMTVDKLEPGIYVAVNAGKAMKFAIR